MARSLLLRDTVLQLVVRRRGSCRFNFSTLSTDESVASSVASSPFNLKPYTSNPCDSRDAQSGVPSLTPTSQLQGEPVPVFKHPTPSFPLSRSLPPLAADSSYPPTTRTPTITSINTFDDIHRPTPRPITLSNDDSKLYHPRDSDAASPPQDKKHLRFFSGKENARAGEKDKAGEVVRKYARDEL